MFTLLSIIYFSKTVVLKAHYLCFTVLFRPCLEDTIIIALSKKAKKRHKICILWRNRGGLNYNIRRIFFPNVWVVLLETNSKIHFLIPAHTLLLTLRSPLSHPSFLLLTFPQPQSTAKPTPPPPFPHLFPQPKIQSPNLRKSQSCYRYQKSHSSGGKSHTHTTKYP